MTALTECKVDNFNAKLINDYVYNAIIRDVRKRSNVVTTYGVKNMIDFYFELFEKEIILKESFSESRHENSRLYTVVNNVLQYFPKYLSSEHLIGRACKIQVERRPFRDGYWMAVKRVLGNKEAYTQPEPDPAEGFARVKDIEDLTD